MACTSSSHDCNRSLSVRERGEKKKKKKKKKKGKTLPFA